MNTQSNVQISTVKTNGDGRTEGKPTKPDGDENKLQSEQDMLYRLKAAIDSRGRYSYRLQDMASGYAAGKGITATAARMEIERGFTDQFGHSPQEYLDRHYEEMRSNGVGRDSSQEKHTSQSREQTASAQLGQSR